MAEHKNQVVIAEILVSKGEEIFKHSHESVVLTKNEEANEILKNIEDYPHAFVLACIMDRKIKAERAWLIPYRIAQEVGSFAFSPLLELSQEEIRDLFVNNNLHFYNNVMAENLYLAVQRIHEKYNDDASEIWKNEPRSATVIMRFLEFKGVGIKIATMAANLLVRYYKIPLKTRICIDFSPDVHVKRVYKRIGFISHEAQNEALIYCARELNPDYPGIFDFSCWRIGRNWCRPKNPECDKCYLD